MACSGSPTSLTISGPDGALYTLTVAGPDFVDSGTRICYTLSNISPPGTRRSGIGDFTLALCADVDCSTDFVTCCTNAALPFDVLEDSTTVFPCPSPQGDCFEFPVPIQVDTLATLCGLKIEFDPAIEPPGDPEPSSRTFCLFFPGVFLDSSAARFELRTGAGVISDPTCVVLSPECLPPFYM